MAPLGRGAAGRTRARTVDACRRSLARLRTDRIDLYLLHWRGSVPLAETVAGFDELMRAGQIRHWGVSNFDTSDLADLAAVTGGEDVSTDQILYNLSRRGPEFDLLPHCRKRGLPVMAYSPVEQGRLLGHPALADVGRRHGISPARAALAWVLQSEGMIAIPRAGTPEHVRDNAAALRVRLDAVDNRLLDRAFPPARTRRPLEVL